LTVKLISVVLAALCLAGCAKDIDNKDAIRAAIEKRVVKTGFDLQSMSVNITRVSFHGKQAEATATFVPKGSTGSGSVAFNYNLERQKDEWVVTSLQQGSMAGHAGPGGGAGGKDEAHPGGPIDPSQPLPPGHPSVGKPN
jgi:hypothetical protein